jgi:hypothetical protein
MSGREEPLRLASLNAPCIDGREQHKQHTLWPLPPTRPPACAAGSASPLKPFLLAAAYAKAGYSGDDTIYWGGAAVKARRNLFANATAASDPAWSNQDAYSWHSYGKTGAQLRTSYNDLIASLASDNASDLAPIWLTEHQSKTSGSWDDVNTTTDFASEASRVASQVMYMAMVGGGALGCCCCCCC